MATVPLRNSDNLNLICKETWISMTLEHTECISIVTLKKCWLLCIIVFYMCFVQNMSIHQTYLVKILLTPKYELRTNAFVDTICSPSTSNGTAIHCPHGQFCGMQYITMILYSVDMSCKFCPNFLSILPLKSFRILSCQFHQFLWYTPLQWFCC